jgi:colanic acid biosynthesis protein WcaH
MYISTEEYTRIQELLPILCVDVVLTYRGKCLLLQRLNHPALGQWWFPGGRVHKNELIKDAALRKSRAEVGLAADFKGVLSVEETIFPKIESMISDIHTVNVCCQMVASDITGLAIDKDHNAFRWVSFEEAESLNLHSAVLNPLAMALPH